MIKNLSKARELSAILTSRGVEFHVAPHYAQDKRINGWTYSLISHPDIGRLASECGAEGIELRYEAGDWVFSG